MTDFHDAVREMRFQQKRFFRSEHGTTERTDALRLSRVAEARVDQMLAMHEAGEVQPDLFAEEEAS